MKNRILWIALSVMLFTGSILLVGYFVWANGYMGPVTESVATTTYGEFTYPTLTEPVIVPQTEPGETVETTEYVSPIDFDELHAFNPDIIGWLYMSSPDISLPILRSPDDDSFYLYHNAERAYDRQGALFVEHQYNSDDFSDMCTVIYGHRMSNGSMFGTMQATMSEEGFFDSEQYIVIYQQNCSRVYQIFATIPRDNSHILYYNDFTDESVYDSFIRDVYSQTGVDVNLVQDARPQYGDHLLILSSCLWGDRTSRYLVIAREI